MKNKLHVMMGLIPMLAAVNTIQAQERPNIILIMADDMGWGDVGFNGNKVIKTPNLDKLAGEGTVFDRFYSGCALSSPTRASVLTGRNPFRTGVFSANVGILRPEEVTLPEILLQRGYMTGHFGKWHLGTLTHTEKDANRGRPGNTALYNVPMEHGYMESFVTESKVPTYDPMRKPLKNDRRFWDCLKEGEPSLEYGTFYWKHSGEKAVDNLSGDDSKIIMDHVLPFIQKSKSADRPFFSAVWFHAPHLPCVAGPKYAAMYQNLSVQERNYYGCISALDEQVGRLVDYLKQEGLYDNTIICFCSDNGPELSTPGTASSLRGKKRDLYEGGIRVPSLMVWNNHIPAGKRTQHIAYTSDYLPSVVDLLGLQAPPYQLDGESLLPFFMQNAERKNPLIFAVQRQAALIEQQFKLVCNKGEYELYDIESDISETKDISSQYPSEVARMKKIMDKKLSDIKASFDGEEYGTVSVNRVSQKWVDVRAVPKKK